jgi:saccharopine dehydrogenase-like NADP-dependent oxidoreductase
MKILLLGGYGSVGHLLCEALAQDPSFDITIAGRNIHSADSLVQKIIKIFPQARIQGVVMDWSAANFAEKLAAYNPELLVNTAGPFTHQNYTVAQSCVALGIHYIDTADDRAFVTNIVALNDKALEKSVCIISGAGIVSGITSAVIDEYAQQFSILREVEFGLVYGNQIELGDARIISLLTQAGESFWRLEKGNLRSVFGWQNRHR